MIRRGQRRNRVKTITSVCLDLIIRGNKKQIAEKYEELARNEMDMVIRNMYLQHAEHYTRVVTLDRGEIGL